MIKSVSPNTAKSGNFIEFGDGLRGVVIAVLNNTVVADLTIMENFNPEIMGHERQVVHHTKYKVIR